MVYKYKGHILTKKFDYCCGSGNKHLEHSVFANIISKTEDTVKIERATGFGIVKWTDTEFRKNEFYKLYDKIECEVCE